MNETAGLGPFRPGPWGLPPYLAGRESEQALVRAYLRDLQAGRAPPCELVLHGPRGNGKTALLVWLEHEAAFHPAVEVLRLTPAGIPTETKLVERLLPVSWLQRLAPREIALYGIRWRPGDDRPPPLDEALATRARRAPLIMLLDEPIHWTKRWAARFSTRVSRWAESCPSCSCWPAPPTCDPD